VGEELHGLLGQLDRVEQSLLGPRLPRVEQQLLDDLPRPDGRFARPLQLGSHSLGIALAQPRLGRVESQHDGPQGRVDLVRHAGR